jgi:hypothetical protein
VNRGKSSDECTDESRVECKGKRSRSGVVLGSSTQTAGAEDPITRDNIPQHYV